MSQNLLKIPKRFETERLKLRSYQEGDGKLFYEIMKENREHLKLVTPHFLLNVSSPEEGEKIVLEIISYWNSRGKFIIGVWEKGSNNFVAEVSIIIINSKIPMAEIGYYVVKNKEGKGFVTESVKASIDFCFDHLKINKLQLCCDEDNLKSVKVAERCGFIKEGVLRKAAYRNDGIVTNKVHYGMTREDFEILNTD